MQQMLRRLGSFKRKTLKIIRMQKGGSLTHFIRLVLQGEHITDTYITETDTAELENLTHTLS